MRELRLKLKKVKADLYNAIVKRAAEIVDGARFATVPFYDIILINKFFILGDRGVEWTVNGLRKVDNKIVLVGYNEQDDLGRSKEIPFNSDTLSCESLDMISWLLDQDMYNMGMIID